MQKHKNEIDMAVYIVTYDLKQECNSSSYNQLISLIKDEGVWACLGESSYLIETNCSPVELRAKFKKALDSNDMLYVGAVEAPAAWMGYSQQVSDWIKAKL